MAAQFSLFEDAPEPTDRLLFGLFPPPEVAERITGVGEAARARNGLRGQLLLPERFHITLFHIGDYVGLPRDAVVKAADAAVDVIAHPFTVRFDRVASFRNGPFVMLGDEGELAALQAFRQTLGRAIARTGLKTKSSLTQFKPHVTLLYEKGVAVPEHPVAPVEWTAHEFVLVHSLLGQSRHIPLGRWPLKGSLS